MWGNPMPQGYDTPAHACPDFEWEQLDPPPTTPTL